MTQIERFLLDDQPPPVSHYCHVVKAGNQIWLSGTVGMRPDGSAPDDVVEQFRRPEHIVKVTVFLTNINDRVLINPIRQTYFGEHRPASTLVEVSALVTPQLKVEIEAEAVIG